MTTPKETALSMSRLTIGEIPQSESNSSGCCHEAAQSDQSATQLESNGDEMGAFSCVKLSGKDMDMSEGKTGRPDVDQREDGVCAQCGRDLAETLHKASEDDDIHINENYGTIFIDVSSQRSNHSSIGTKAEDKKVSLPSQTNSVAHSSPKSPRAISDGFRSSKKARQNRLEINGAKRRLHLDLEKRLEDKAKKEID